MVVVVVKRVVHPRGSVITGIHQSMGHWHFAEVVRRGLLVDRVEGPTPARGR